jgi:hypothetical protein
MIKKIQLNSVLLAIVFIILAIGLISAGYFYYKNFKKTHRIGIEQQLTAIADLKVGEIVQWRKERLGNASVYYKNASDGRTGSSKHYTERSCIEDASGCYFDLIS